MRFNKRSLREIAEMVVGDVVGDVRYFPYRSSSEITQFFEYCDLDFVHDGSTRRHWAYNRLVELIEEPQEKPNALPNNFMNVLRILMDKADEMEGDKDRKKALELLNISLQREGYEAFYGDDQKFYIRHTGTNTISNTKDSPHRPLTPREIQRKEQLNKYLNSCSEDELIEKVLLPLFRQLGFHRISSAGHKDKALEYGKDIWMRCTLPTQHMLYFGVQVKKGKLDAAGNSRGTNTNISEIHNQALMMLGHEIFDPEANKKALVDHAFIVAGGEITKHAKNWLGERLDASKRRQIIFMDRDDILNLYIVSSLPLPDGALPMPNIENEIEDDIPF